MVANPMASENGSTLGNSSIRMQQRAEFSNLLWMLGRKSEWDVLRQKLRSSDCFLRNHQQQAMIFLTFAINQKVPDDIIELILKCNPDVFEPSSPTTKAKNFPLPFQVAILRGSSTNTRIVLEAARQQSIFRQHQQHQQSL